MLSVAAGATIEDEGRAGYRKFGVPHEGAFDRESALLANTLVGNPRILPCFELPLMGGAFQIEGPGIIGIVGCDCEIKLDGRSLGAQMRFPAGAGQLLEIGPPRIGARAYLAVHGGFLEPPILGSASGRFIERREFVAATEGRVLESARLAEPPRSVGGGELARDLRFIPGPQSDMFDISRFLVCKFTVSRHSDRRGIRLEGNFLSTAKEIPSEPACIGAIQITAGGMPIVVGPAGPTIGGYPKIGCVISADLSILGQLPSGVQVKFQKVSLQAAAEEQEKEEQRISKLVRTIKAAVSFGY